VETLCFKEKQKPLVTKHPEPLGLARPLPVKFSRFFEQKTFLSNLGRAVNEFKSILVCKNSIVALLTSLWCWVLGLRAQDKDLLLL
jgi:hypothetical protein